MSAWSVQRVSALGAVIVGGLMVAAVPRPALAWMQYCNHTNFPVDSAFAYEHDSKFVAKGWYTIPANSCAFIWPDSLDRQQGDEPEYYYFYGVSALQKMEWKGEYPFCVKDETFEVVQDNLDDKQLGPDGKKPVLDCARHSGQKKMFFGEIEIDHGSHDYTVNFDTQPPSPNTASK